MANKKREKNEKEEKLVDINIDEIKKEVVEYAQNSVDSKIDDLVRKADKRIINSKNKSIFKRNIVIIVLLCLSGFLAYLLYNEGYFDKFFNHQKEDAVIVEKEDNSSNEVNVEEQKEEKKVSELDKLKKEYSKLLDIVNISEDSNYLEDLYNGKLTNKMKLSIILSNINQELFEKDENMYIISSSLIEEEYSKLFNSDNYKNTSFILNNVDIKYLKTGNIYIFEELPNIVSNIEREITGIKKSDNEVKITVVEGLIKDNKLYNVLTKELVSEDNVSLIDNSKKLNKATYVFNVKNDGYILSKVEI